MTLFRPAGTDYKADRACLAGDNGKSER